MTLPPLAEIRKAVYGFAAPALAVLIAASLHDGISLTEWLTAISAGLGIGGGVYALPNRPPKG